MNQATAYIPKKVPHHLKVSDRLQKSNLMIDANSTFINFDRSKSGIGGAIGNSALAIGGLGGSNYSVN